MRTAIPRKSVRPDVGRWTGVFLPGHASIAWWLLFLHLTLSPLLFSLATLDVFEASKAALLQATALLLAALGVSAWLGSVAGGRSGAGARSETGPTARFFDPITLGFLLFTLSALVSMVCSISPGTSWRGSAESVQGVRTLLGYLVLYLATRRVCGDVRDGRRLLAAVVFATAVATAYGVVQALHGDPVRWRNAATLAGQVRPFATLGHTTSLAAYLVMALPLLGVFALPPARGVWARSLLILVGIVSVGIVVLTLSRAAWLAGACAAVLMLLGKLNSDRETGRQGDRETKTFGGWRARLACGLLVCLSPCLLVWISGAEGRAGLTERVRRLFDGEGRKDIWRAAWQLFRDRPICGWGTDCFRLAFGIHRPVSLWQEEHEGTPTRAHNEMLHVLATQGLLGAAAVALMCVGLVRGSLGAWRRARGADRLLVLGVAASVLAFAVQALFGFTVAGLGSLFVTCAALLSRWSAADPGPATAPASDARSLTSGLLAGVVLTAALFAGNFGPAHLPLALALVSVGVLAGLAVLRLEAESRQGDRETGRQGDTRTTGPQPQRRVSSVSLSPRLPVSLSGLCRLALAAGVVVLLVVGIVRPFLAGQAGLRGERALADDPVAALRAQEEAVSLDPDDDGAWTRLGEAAQASARQTVAGMERQRFWQRARQALERACALVPADPYHHANLARLLGELTLAEGVPSQAALDEWEWALTLDPVNPRLLIEAGRSVLSVGDSVRARRWLTQGCSWYPDYPAFLALLGACDLAEGKPAAAFSSLERAVRADWHGDAEGYSRALATMTTVCLTLGQPPQAEFLVTRLVEREPDWPMTWFLLGKVQEACGRPTQAADAYRHVLTLDPNHASAAAALQRLNRCGRR